MALATAFRHTPTTPWLLAYLAINIATAFIVYHEGELIGDVVGMQIPNFGVVPWVLLCLLASYLLIVLVVFRLFMSLRLRTTGRLFDTRLAGRDVGIVLLLLQVGFVVFFLRTGTFVAGSTMRADSVWSQVWVLLSTDTLFLIYYGVYRDSRLFYPNLVLSLGSNVLRGWSGIFIVIIFFEFCRLIRCGKLRLSHVLVSGVAVVLLYPVLLLVKLHVRSQFEGGASVSELFSIASTVLSDTSPEQFGELLTVAFMQMVGRLQLLSDVVAVTYLSDELGRMVTHGLVVPFWWEGIHGIALDRLFGAERSMNIGVAFASLIDPAIDIGTWNANIGYVGWFFIMPAYAVVYLAYTAMLAFLSVLLLRRISSKPLAKDMLWYGWLVFLVPGWLASFVLFVHSLFVFMCIQRITDFVHKCRWRTELSTHNPVR